MHQVQTHPTAWTCAPTDAFREGPNFPRSTPTSASTAPCACPRVRSRPFSGGRRAQGPAQFHCPQRGTPKAWPPIVETKEPLPIREWAEGEVQARDLDRQPFSKETARVNHPPIPHLHLSPDRVYPWTPAASPSASPCGHFGALDSLGPARPCDSQTACPCPSGPAPRPLWGAWRWSTASGNRDGRVTCGSDAAFRPGGASRLPSRLWPRGGRSGRRGGSARPRPRRRLQA